MASFQSFSVWGFDAMLAVLISIIKVVVIG